MMIFYERIRTRANTIKPSGLITACAALSAPRTRSGGSAAVP